MKTTVYTLLMFIGLTTLVRAVDDRQAFHEAMKTCLAETGVVKPEKGTPPSEADRAKIDACLGGKGITRHEHRERPKHSRKHHKAVKACRKELGLAKPQRGTPPSEDERARVETCLKAKGIARGE
jgi:hypothetical protein